MKFWDSSAIIPLCIREAETETVRSILEDDDGITVWWGTAVECFSAFARLRREGILRMTDEDMARSVLSVLSGHWNEILPVDEIRAVAGRLLLTHSLHSADSMQLAAAILWAEKSPAGSHFICLDNRLRDAARKEGFMVLPEGV